MNLFKPNNSKSGFTLIELLVAIAIIAILAAILFPVFGRARENARRSSCSSNLKQVALGFAQYVQDYDEYYPARRTYAPSTPAPAGWVSLGWAGLIQPYVKSDQLFHCPSDENDSKSTNPLATGCSNCTTAGRSPQIDYFYNKRMGGRYSSSTMIDYGIHQAAIANVSLTIMSGDNISAMQNNNIMPASTGGLNGENCRGIIGDGKASNCGDPQALSQEASRRHLDGANYVFADFHVKYQKPTQIYGNATPFTESGSSPTFRVEQ